MGHQDRPKKPLERSKSFERNLCQRGNTLLTRQASERHGGTTARTAPERAHSGLPRATERGSGLQSRASYDPSLAGSGLGSRATAERAASGLPRGPHDRANGLQSRGSYEPARLGGPPARGGGGSGGSGALAHAASCSLYELPAANSLTARTGPLARAGSLADLRLDVPETPRDNDRDALKEGRLRTHPLQRWSKAASALAVVTCVAVFLLVASGFSSVPGRDALNVPAALPRGFALRDTSGATGAMVRSSGMGRSRRAVARAQREAGMAAWKARGIEPHARGAKLGVCIMTADFWGIKSAGGTATAYHLLAEALGEEPGLDVTFVGVTKRFTDCQEGARIHAHAPHGVHFECLEPQHFIPEVVETYWYEQLSHAVLTWLQQNRGRCDLVHAHEWGGVFADVVAASAFRQLKPGLRVVVETHGGHFWSTQGQTQRPFDVISLRIDQSERMILQLADTLISPTLYMTAFLKQRGWRLPPTQLVIPNVVPTSPVSDARMGRALLAEVNFMPSNVAGPAMKYVGQGEDGRSGGWGRSTGAGVAQLLELPGTVGAAVQEAGPPPRDEGAGSSTIGDRAATQERLLRESSPTEAVAGGGGAPDGGASSGRVAAPAAERPVWRLAFFSRLEERKGLKLFVAAVSRLDPAKLDKRFEVHFVGAEAAVDMVSSGEWLRSATAAWPWPIHIRVNADRSEALEVLAAPGTLLVLCSLVDNMPYVVAEAAVKGIPFVVFDVGGIVEMIDLKAHSDVVIATPTLNALAQRLADVLAKGYIRTVRLSERVMTSKQQWLAWHRQFLADWQRREEDDFAMAGAVARAERRTVQAVRVGPAQNAVELWEAVCAPRGSGDFSGLGGAGGARAAGSKGLDDEDGMPLLLLPEGYEFLDESTAPEELAELLMIGAAQELGVGALAFGAELPSGKLSFPTGPTWILYAAHEGRCLEDVPLLLRRDVFCASYVAQARVFRTYSSWVLALLLRKAGLRTHTFPRAMFRVPQLTHQGYNCLPDRTPVDRRVSFASASNTLGDPEQVLFDLSLAPYPRPAASLVDDHPTEQMHKGWMIGYHPGNASAIWKPLTWRSGEEGGREGAWGCADASKPYPALQHSLVHPCLSTSRACCGDAAASFVLRFVSFFSSPHAMLIMAYEVWPICGDGLDLEVRHTAHGNATARQLLARGVEPDMHDKPQRQKVEFRLGLRVGDMLDFVVHPRTSMDCDGVYIVDMQIWQDEGGNQSIEN